MQRLDVIPSGHKSAQASGDMPGGTGTVGAEVDALDPERSRRLGAPRWGQTEMAPAGAAKPAKSGSTYATTGR